MKMKKQIYLLALSALLVSCNNSQKSDSQDQNGNNTETTEAGASTITDTNAPADISNIAISDKELGTFPYLSLPTHYNFGYKEEAQESDIKSLDKEYFAFNGKLFPIEGKSYKIHLEKNRNTDKERFNSLIVEKGLDKAIVDLGGVKVNNVAIPKSEIEHIKSIEGENYLGYISSVDLNRLQDVKTYVIKTKDKEVWIQFSLLNEESGVLTVIEKSTLEG